jgi:hypothetical protein
MNSFSLGIFFLEIGTTQDLPSKNLANSRRCSNKSNFDRSYTNLWSLSDPSMNDKEIQKGKRTTEQAKWLLANRMELPIYVLPSY